MTSGAPDDPGASPRRRVAVFRWRGIIPLVLMLSVLTAVWLLFGERIIRSTIEEAGTKALGTELDIADLRIHSLQSAVELNGIAIANPFDPRRNLVEIKRLVIELEPAPLLEKKLVLNRLTIGDVRTNTARAAPARPVTAGGFAPAAMQEMQRWAKQFDVPLLSFTPIDTIKSIVLDPMQLASVQAALALAQGVDSARSTLQRRYAALHLQETLDSSRALVTRLQATNAHSLGIAGARTAAADVRRTAARVDATRQLLEGLATGTRAQLDTLQTALRAVDSARKSDYAFARRLVKLPSFDAPDIGAALFGKITIDKVQQALYWTTLARQYIPPGLQPRQSSGPPRLRAAGTTVQFVKPQAYPRFLLRRADLDVTVSDGPARGKYIAAVTYATTEPALVGQPTLFAVRRVATGSAVDSLRVTGMLDHTGARPRETLNFQAAGVDLPGFSIPGLPYRADPGRGATGLHLTLDGDQIAALWTVRSGVVSWTADTVSTRRLSSIESLVAKVLTGISALQVNASVVGPAKTPSLAVSSNLDRVVADQVKNVIGTQVAAAEAKVRARVDSLAEDKEAPVRAKLNDLRTEADKQIADARSKLDAEKQKLDAQLRSLTAGLVGLP